MGAVIVIGIDISSPLMQPEDVNNLFSTTGQLTSIMTRSNAEPQIATLTDRDVFIGPELGDFSRTFFINATTNVPAGRQVAEMSKDKLSRLSLSESAHKAHLVARAARPVGNVSPVIEFVLIENDSAIRDGMISDRLRLPLGSALDRKQLEEDIARN